MITLAQIKAARALLDWTQDALAKAAGLSLPGVNNLERGLTSPRESTLVAIEQALRTAGVDFIDTTGVRLCAPDFSLQTLEGPDWLARYDADIIESLNGPADEIVQFSCSERQWMVHGSVTNHHYIDHRNKVNFSERIIIPTSADFVTNRRDVYRQLSVSYFADTSYQVYANRVALILWPHQKILLVKSAAMAASYRAQFNSLWAIAKPFSTDSWRKVEKWEYGT